MLPLTLNWQMDVERGPDWLFVRLTETEGSNFGAEGLAEALWNLMQEQFAHRLVLEMDQVRMLRSVMLGELIKLHKRVHASGGLMRLCGLSESNQQVLCLSRLTGHFPPYASREEAVMGRRPNHPR